MAVGRRRSPAPRAGRLVRGARLGRRGDSASRCSSRCGGCSPSRCSPRAGRCPPRRRAAADGRRRLGLLRPERVRARWPRRPRASCGATALALAVALLVLLMPPLEALATQLAVISYCIPLIAIGPIVLVVFGGRTPMIFLAAIVCLLHDDGRDPARAARRRPGQPGPGRRLRRRPVEAVRRRCSSSRRSRACSRR